MIDPRCGQCFLESPYGDHQTLPVGFGERLAGQKGCAAYCYHRCLKTNTAQNVSSREGATHRTVVVREAFWKKVVDRQANRTQDVTYSATSETMDKHPTVVAVSYRETGTFVIVSRATGDPATVAGTLYSV